LSLVLFYLFTTCQNAVARPEQSTSMTTEEPLAMTTHLSDDHSESNESAGGETDDDSEEDDKMISVDSKSAFTCSPRPGDLERFETECMMEYKAMKKAKCNNTTDEDKMKKMNPMESMESGHSEHMGKREAPIEDEMNSTDTMTTTVKPMRHRKRSCHYYQCILKKLDVLDESTMLPNEDMFKTWTKNTVTEESESMKLQERVAECFSDLRDSGFYSMDNSKSQEVSAEAPSVKKGKTSCSAALKLLKCLSKQDTECPIFKFP
ncbi:hypothetical protein L9F63_021173, partial [Diploptera punctata]